MNNMVMLCVQIEKKGMVLEVRGFRSDYSPMSDLQKQVFSDVVGMFGEKTKGQFEEVQTAEIQLKDQASALFVLRDLCTGFHSLGAQVSVF